MIQLPFEADLRADALRYCEGGYGFVTDREIAAYPALRIPELSNGFVRPWWYGAFSSAPSNCDGRALPVHFRADTGRGCFAVSAVLAAETDCREILVFISRRRLAWRGALKAGERVEIEALCDVSPIYPAGHSGLTDSSPGCREDNAVDLTLAAMGGSVRLESVRIRESNAPRLFLMGDSTVTDQTAMVPYAPGCTYCGWGQMLPVHLGLDYCVSNHAHSGLSTESFRAEGHYANLLSLVRPDDLVLIQFGHNDQKHRHLDAFGGYYENLLRYIRELTERGAVPILVTPLARNTWKSETEYNDLLEEQAAAMFDLGEAHDVPVLDLHGAMMDCLCARGMDASRCWFHPCDYSHLNDFGAHMAAGFVVSAMAEYGFTEKSPQPAWLPYGPMEELALPEGAEPPEGARPLVDYGLIADFPWPIQS